MQINRLRLLGFKSFVEASELIIMDGLTGIVGPNGCGKSNLLEALRWVMGETSYKTMRASTMDDVIFSGTQNRPARNFSEVTLFIDNSSRTAPAAYNDQEVLEVCRRIEREAGSAYRINGKEVRAKDVQLLFADASTGARSPALVRQGQIGQIINSKPQARRLILEEAAGITGLHSRRHEAELRLRAAENNLQRLLDVQAQIGAQLAGLRRQARQAVRYKEISQKLRETEALQFHLKWLDLGERVESEEESVRNSLTEIAGLTELESAALRKQTEASDALPPLRKLEAEKAAALQRMIVERENLDREETEAKNRVQELEGQLVQHNKDISREEELIVEAETVVKQLRSEESELHNATAGREQTERHARLKLDKISSELADSEKMYSSITDEVAGIKARRNQLDQNMFEQSQIIEKLTQQKTDVESNIRSLCENDDVTQQINETVSVIDSLSDQLDKDSQTMENAEATSKSLRLKLQSNMELLTKARQKAGKLDVEIETLTGLLVSQSPEDSNSVFDLIEVEEGYELALAAALGDDLEAQDSPDAPVRWTELPKSRIPDVSSDILEESGSDKLPDGAIPLANFVKGPLFLNHRLQSIGVIDEPQGKTAQGQLLAGQRLVSRRGDLWRWDGYAVSAGAPTAAAKRLAEKSRLNSLNAEQDRVKSDLTVAQSQFSIAEKESIDADARVINVRNIWVARREELGAAREKLANLEHQKQKRVHELETFDQSRRNLSTGLIEAESRQQRSASEIETLPCLEKLETELENHTTSVEELRNQFTEARATMAGLEQEFRIRKDRLAWIEDELERWKNRSENAATQIGSLKSRSEQAESRLNELKVLPSEFKIRRSKVLTAISDAETNRQQSADTLVEAEAELGEITKALGEIQSTLSDARELRAASEARLENAREQRAELARQIRNELECSPDECLELSGSIGLTELPDLRQVETSIVKLRSDRERLGSVNLRAEEEAVQLNEQFESMESEIADLNEAILQLKRGIEDLNREGRKRLLTAFDEVNTHFKQLFTTLFGGGEAQLQLVESDDPLQAGLEILARPPGKKPQILTLLSGGEKALTAMSLIFAVFLTNPSPICVLDEVDAPLDDTNVERFCQLMEEMSDKTDTRFLVITHHPTTMARMDRLFGVTMAEKGISQLVSVDLATAEGFREAG